MSLESSFSQFRVEAFQSTNIKVEEPSGQLGELPPLIGDRVPTTRAASRGSSQRAHKSRSLGRTWRATRGCRRSRASILQLRQSITTICAHPVQSIDRDAAARSEFFSIGGTGTGERLGRKQGRKLCLLVCRVGALIWLKK